MVEKLRLAWEELQWLFGVAGSYGEREFDPKTGQPKEKPENWAERASHEADVLKVWRRIKQWCSKLPPDPKQPAYQPWRIGPEDPKERPTWKTPEFGTSEEERDGIYWLCWEALDPRSSRKVSTSAADEVIWPILAKIRRVKAMEKALEAVAPIKRERLEEDPIPAEPVAAPKE